MPNRLARWTLPCAASPYHPRRFIEPASPLRHRAAVSGSPAAMARLGGCLLRGEGMPADPAAGVEWLRRAARQDDPAALSALGAVWEAGAPPACGMPPDMHKAVKYYRCPPPLLPLPPLPLVRDPKTSLWVRYTRLFWMSARRDTRCIYLTLYESAPHVQRSISDSMMPEQTPQFL